ncbi:transcription factor 23-like isoform X2 [Limulus polyphemus]|uniref:Transcription factor 23-like isoform X2 n=1 Tax=Limulus polyphemus TaxID=6850 RepID=A0ABM1T8Y9_LIMPO|nr:transcription factor 23-like isoform X2 [Limulus polyphemus]
MSVVSIVKGKKIWPKGCSTSRNAERERTRVRSLRDAFQTLQRALPYVPPNTKLSKLDVLILATTYISHLTRILGEEDMFPSNDFVNEVAPNGGSQLSQRLQNHIREGSYLRPVKKWPMRSRLYAGTETWSFSSTMRSATTLTTDGRMLQEKSSCRFQT